VLGPVFRTYEPQRDRLVAVKAFKIDLVPEDVARLAEALGRLVAAQLPRAGIVPAFDAGVEGATAFLAMEYVAGETLDVAFRHLAPAPLGRALPILTSMAGAIDTAWAAGFGHGALHPRDVFIRSGSDDVLITGFGIVPALEAVGFRPAPRRPYTAPERAGGMPADIRGDVFSLGAIAYELLTRKRPVGPADQELDLAGLAASPQGERIGRALATAMAARPEDRFADARAFVQALGEAEETTSPGAGAGEIATAPSLFEQLRRPRRPTHTLRRPRRTRRKALQRRARRPPRPPRRRRRSRFSSLRPLAKPRRPRRPHA